MTYTVNLPGGSSVPFLPHEEVEQHYRGIEWLTLPTSEAIQTRLNTHCIAVDSLDQVADLFSNSNVQHFVGLDGTVMGPPDCGLFTEEGRSRFHAYVADQDSVLREEMTNRLDSATSARSEAPRVLLEGATTLDAVERLRTEGKIHWLTSRSTARTDDTISDLLSLGLETLSELMVRPVRYISPYDGGYQKMGTLVMGDGGRKGVQINAVLDELYASRHRTLVQALENDTQLVQEMSARKDLPRGMSDEQYDARCNAVRAGLEERTKLAAALPLSYTAVIFTDSNPMNILSAIMFTVPHATVLGYDLRVCWLRASERLNPYPSDEVVDLQIRGLIEQNLILSNAALETADYQAQWSTWLDEQLALTASLSPATTTEAEEEPSVEIEAELVPSVPPTNLDTATAMVRQFETAD